MIHSFLMETEFSVEDLVVCNGKDSKKTSNFDVNGLPKQKPGMSLSLEKPIPSSMDETPTPTRFIRNCEEVGLFEELKSGLPNPFEETFRKAVEAVKAGATPTLNSSGLSSLISNEDTLHTPKVFPELMDTAVSLINKGPSLSAVVDPDKVIRQEADTSLQTISPLRNGARCISGVVREDSPSTVTSTGVVSCQPVPSKLPTPTNNVQVLIKMPDGSLLEVSTKPVEAKVLPVVPTNKLPLTSEPQECVILSADQQVPPAQLNLIPERVPNINLVKQKLKAHLKSTKPSGTKAIRPNDLKPEKRKLLDNPTEISGSVNEANKGTVQTVPLMPSTAQPSASPKSKRPVVEESEEEERIRKQRERNRAAASRCREKRKQWVSELGLKADLMSATNQALLLEVSVLRAEVARLKALLLTHKNCPVTLAAAAAESTAATAGPSPITVAWLADKPAVQEVEIQSVQLQPVETVNVTKNVAPKRVTAPDRQRLSLDIENARKRQQVVTQVIDLASPLVRKDEVLSSVAAKTPNEPDKTLIFEDRTHDHVMDIEEVRAEMEKPVTPTVIQLNPNARGSSVR